MIISLNTAKALLEAAVKQAVTMKITENIAIVDEGGNLIAFHRMDNGKIAGIDIAINKAWTSVALQVATANLANTAQPGSPSYGINTTNQGKVVILGGGIPLFYKNKIVGGIGVSGATSAQDIEVAGAAVQTFERLTNTQEPRR